MTDKATASHADESNTIKDPSTWTTGDQPMTGAQKSYLHTLAEEAHEEVSDDLTKAEASMKIDELQDKTGRHTTQGKGTDHDASHGSAKTSAKSSSKTRAKGK